MSWSFYAIGNAADFAAELDRQCGLCTGDSREEFEAAKPHLAALIALNTAGDLPAIVKIEANGSASKSGGKVVSSSCNVQITRLPPFIRTAPQATAATASTPAPATTA